MNYFNRKCQCCFVELTDDEVDNCNNCIFTYDLKEETELNFEENTNESILERK